MATQKKTADVDYSMQEKIIALYELQKIDSKIDEINKVKGELPLEVQDLEDEMTGLKTRIDNINAEIEELNTLTKQRKREVDQAKILIGNYKEQQNNVRNNREFDAITKEIEYQELEIELAEKRLKEYAAGVKAKKLQLEEAEAVADGRAADLAAKKSELEGGSATRIRPQYSQTISFLPWRISTWRCGGIRLKQPPQASRFTVTTARPLRTLRRIRP